MRSVPSPRRWLELPTPVAATICIFALLAIAGLIGKIHTPAVAVQPTPALPIIVIATTKPQPPTPAAQVAAVAPNALRRAVVAYDAPANVLGAIEQGRVYSVLVRFGTEWLQADVSGSGVVWLKADQVLDLPDGLVDWSRQARP